MIKIKQALKNSSIFNEVIKKTVINDANFIFSKMIVLNDINSDKYEQMKGVCTTELLNNIDILTIYEIAHECNLEVNLPNHSIRGSHIIFHYKWGNVILLANIIEN